MCNDVLLRMELCKLKFREGKKRINFKAVVVE